MMSDDPPTTISQVTEHLEIESSATIYPRTQVSDLNLRLTMLEEKEISILGSRLVTVEKDVSEFKNSQCKLLKNLEDVKASIDSLIKARNTGQVPALIEESPEVVNTGDETEASSIKVDSNMSALHLQEKLLRTNAKCLRRLLFPEPSKSLSKCTISDIYKNRLVAIQSKSKELERSMLNYMKNTKYDVNFCESLSDIIEDAANYSAEIWDLYQSLGVHKRSQATKLYDSLSKFTKHSNISVFEFFRRFSAYTEDFDIPEEKAELLYNKFLSEDIQEEVSQYKQDYLSMKRVLIHRYGDLKTVTSDILLPLFKSSIPTHSANPNIKLVYFRRLNSVLQSINSLLTCKDIPREEAQEYLFSQDFLHLLISYLPDDAKEKFVDKMQVMDEDTVRIRGKIPFRLILDLVAQCYQTAEIIAQTQLSQIQTPIQSSRKKEISKPFKLNTAAANNSVTDTDSDSDRELTKVQRKAKPISNLKFPCVVNGHKHQIYECREFFFKSPQERFEDLKKFEYKYCLICLQSGTCNSSMCSNWKEIPTILICKECRKNSLNQSTRKVFSVLYCFNHNHNKPSNLEIMSALETYIPGFQADLLKAPINMASHFQVLAGLKTSKPESKSRQVNPLEPVPAFNTNNGKTSKPPIVDVIPEVCQDSISVMQYLNIGGRSVLCLFDRGANQHLIEAQIAEEIGMKVVSQEPSAIGIVSGDRIWTEYGKYQMLLGPTSSGNYFELIAQGITAVTGKFPKYDLTAANEEAQQSTNLHPGTPLPPYIGNERVGLIIGLKCPEIEPTCVFTLPSGLGIYKSPFRDIFGSYYCYGGPHESFTDINNKFHGNINHFNIFFSQIINQYRNSVFQSPLILIEPDDYVNDCALSEHYDPNVLSRYQSGSGETKFPSPIGSQDFNVVEKLFIDDRSPTKIISSSQHSQYSISSQNHSSAFKWGKGSVSMNDHMNLCIDKSWILVSRVLCAVWLIVHLVSTFLINFFLQFQM